MFAATTRIFDARLRRSLLYLNILFALGHVLLNAFVGPWIFSSAHGGTLYYHATFLSYVIVTISPDLMKMVFSFR